MYIAYTKIHRSDHIDSSVYMYADDTKLYREIKEPRDHDILQNDLSDWSDLWLLKFQKMFFINY